MSKNKIIKKQWKRIEKLEKELADRCKDVENLIENPEGVESIQAKFNYNTRKQFNNFNLVAGRQPDLNKTGAGLYDHLAEKLAAQNDVNKDSKGKITVPTGYGKGEFMKNVDLHKNFLGLSEHWYIQVTKDNKEILTDYLKNHKQRYEQFSELWCVIFQNGPASFFHSDSKEAGHSTLQPRNGYTEVTTEMVENYMKKWHQIQNFQNSNVVPNGKIYDNGSTGVFMGEFSGDGYNEILKNGPVNVVDNKKSTVNRLDLSEEDRLLIDTLNKRFKKEIEVEEIKVKNAIKSGTLKEYISEFEKSFKNKEEDVNKNSVGDLIDKSWNDVKKEAEQLAAQNDYVENVHPEFGNIRVQKSPPIGPFSNIEDKKQQTIKDFFSILKGDPDYLRSWKDNIAMAFQDNYKWAEDKGNVDIHEISNNAATSFFGTLFRKPFDVIEAEKLYYYMNPGTKMDVPSSAFEIAEKWHNEWQNGWKESDPEESFFDWCIKNKMPNKEGATGYTPVYSPEHLEAKKSLFDSNNVNKYVEKFTKEAFTRKDLIKEQIDDYDAFLSARTNHAIEAGTHNTPDEYVLVKVKVGSVIMYPGYKATVVGSSGIRDHVSVGDLKKRADAMEKCEDQECKPIKQEYEKTLENVTKIFAFIGLREKSAITNGNKDIIFMKTNNYNGGVGYFNTQKPNLMYSPSEMLSDWKSNYVKPLD